MNKSKITASELVLSAIFFLQQKNGVSAKDITKFICEKRGCRQSQVRSEVKRALERATENGIFSKKRGLYRIESGFGRNKISIKVKGLNKKRMRKAKNPGLMKATDREMSYAEESGCEGPGLSAPIQASYPSVQDMVKQYRGFQMAMLRDDDRPDSSTSSRVSVDRIKRLTSKQEGVGDDDDDDEDFLEEDEDEDDDIDYFADDQFPNADDAVKDYEEPEKKKPPPPKRKAQSKSRTRNKCKIKKRKLSKPRRKSCARRKRAKKPPKRPEKCINPQDTNRKGEEGFNEYNEEANEYCDGLEDPEMESQRGDDDYEMGDESVENSTHGCTDDEEGCLYGDYGNEQGNEYYGYASPDEYPSGEEGQEEGREENVKVEPQEAQTGGEKQQLQTIVPTTLASNPKGDGKQETGAAAAATGPAPAQPPQEKTSDTDNRSDKRSKRNRSSSLFRSFKKKNEPTCSAADRKALRCRM